jgi:Secretion system C-terminal sorting domain
VLNKFNSFELTYGSDYKSVTIYNVSGQVVSNFDLPKIGTLTIPANNVDKGLYMFKFNGKNTETVKVIR